MFFRIKKENVVNNTTVKPEKKLYNFNKNSIENLISKFH